jgi:hypothetical protein
MIRSGKIIPCKTCGKLREILPIPARTKRALENFEQRRLLAKEAKRARKAAKGQP